MYNEDSEEADNSSMLTKIKAGLKVNLMCRNTISKEINLEKMLTRLTSMIIVRKKSSETSA
jgi:hypothetical protein